jgi:hypothetical protein
VQENVYEVYKIWGFHGGEYEEWRNIPEDSILVYEVDQKRIFMEDKRVTEK